MHNKKSNQCHSFLWCFITGHLNFFKHLHEQFIKLSLLSQPGDTKSVTLVRIGGKQIIRGGNNIVDGPVADANTASVMNAVNEGGYGFSVEANARSERSCYYMKFGSMINLINLNCTKYSLK